MYQRLALSAHYLVRLSESELQESRWYIPRPYLPNLFLRLPGNDMVDFGGHQRIEKVPFEVLHKCTFPPRESNPYSPYMQIWHFFPWRLLAMTQSLSAVIRESKGYLFENSNTHIHHENRGHTHRIYRISISNGELRRTEWLRGVQVLPKTVCKKRSKFQMSTHAIVMGDPTL